MRLLPTAVAPRPVGGPGVQVWLDRNTSGAPSRSPATRSVAVLWKDMNDESLPITGNAEEALPVPMRLLGTWLTRLIAPPVVAYRNTSSWPFASESPVTISLAVLTKATELPSNEITGEEEVPFAAVVLTVAKWLTKALDLGKSSYRKTSVVPFESPSTRFVAELVYTTNRAFWLIRGWYEFPFAAVVGPPAWLTRMFVPGSPGV